MVKAYLSTLDPDKLTPEQEATPGINLSDPILLASDVKDIAASSATRGRELIQSLEVQVSEMDSTTKSEMFVGALECLRIALDLQQRADTLKSYSSQLQAHALAQLTISATGNLDPLVTVIRSCLADVDPVLIAERPESEQSMEMEPTVSPTPKQPKTIVKYDPSKKPSSKYGIPDSHLPIRTPHPDTGGSVYSCVKCTKKGGNVATLYTHIRRDHLQLAIKCDRCRYKCYSLNAMVKHRKIHQFI